MMKKYLKSFFSELAYETFVKSSAYTEPNVSYTGEDDITHYNPEESPDVKWEAKYGAKIVEKHDNLSGFIAEHEIPASIGVAEDLESVVVNDVVAVIGDKAFKGYTTLKSIVLPDTIQRINSYSFSGCTSLSSVTIPSGVTTIGYKAFAGCSGLTNITVEATTPPSIAAGAFDGIECCITVPEGTEDAYKRVWWQYADRIGGDCSVTTYSITLSGDEFIHADNVTIVWGSYPNTQVITGFGTYTYTTTANTLPIDITVTGPDPSYTYEFDPQLPITLTKQSPSGTIEVTVEEELPKWRAIARDGSEEQTFTAECDSSSAITEDEIGYVSRVDREHFREVSAGTCVTALTHSAFLQYYNLENIDIPSVKNIDINAFGYNYNLTAVTNYNNVETIGNSAFNYCTSLTNAPISDKVTTIGFNAFAYCPLSGSVTIPDSCTYIGEQAFRYCSAMTEVTIGTGITTISGSAFCDCSALTSVTINALVPPVLGLQPFEREGNNFRIYVPCESLSAYKNAEGWSYYANQHKIQAKNCNKYYATYTNGGISIKECDGQPLAENEAAKTDLAKINIGDCVSVINTACFWTCSTLTAATIGSGITSIGDMAFNRCSGLQSITINALVPPTIGSTTFDYSNDCPIIVPCESLSAYRTAWPKYASRITCPNPPFEGKWKATYQGGTTASAECDSTSAITESEIPRYKPNDMETAEIGSCVTEIGNNAFKDYALTSVVIPNSVTTIGHSAFYACNYLSSLTIPSSVTFIDVNAFRSCSRLNSITCLSTTVPTLGNGAFDGSTCNIYVPAESVEAYKAAPEWMYYSSRIQPIQ